MMSGAQLKQWAVYAKDNTVDAIRFHATHTPYYLGWSVRGYRRLCLRWWTARCDDYGQQIASAKQMLRAAKGKPADEAKYKALVDVRRAEYKAHKKKHWIRTGISGLVIVAGTTAAFALGSWWVQLLLALAFIVVGAWFGRPDEPTVQPIQAPTRTSHLGEETMRRVLVEAGVVPDKRAAEIRGIGIPHVEGPGIAYAVHMGGLPASAALTKKKEIAAALGVNTDWVDLAVGGVESELKIWVASEDPFGVVRPSPS